MPKKVPNSYKVEKVNYDKVRHETSVDQSDRQVPYNLRQSGPTKVEMLISTRVRKSPYWHLSMKAGCWRATIYNRVYHPRGYVKPEDGGAMVEYEAIKKTVSDIPELANISNLLLSAYDEYELARFRTKTDSGNLDNMNKILKNITKNNNFILQRSAQ